MNSGDIIPVKAAYGAYLQRWYGTLLANTPALQEFTERGFARCAMWAPGRMVDAVEDMLAAYRKNENGGTAGRNAKLPIVLVAVGRDMMPVNGDVGRQVGERIMVRLTDEPDASVYGYRQGFFELRTQVVIVAPEDATARSIAQQLANFVGSPVNRRFSSQFEWGEYQLQYPVTLETPDVPFMDVKLDAKNLVALAGDITLRVAIPYLEAPKDGEPNDGSSHNPPGYPVVTGVSIADRNVRSSVTVQDDMTVFESGV